MTDVLIVLARSAVLLAGGVFAGLMMWEYLKVRETAAPIQLFWINFGLACLFLWGVSL